jgi:Uma2 family endonuclease
MRPAYRRTLPPPPTLPPLENGDRLTQEEFHRRYEAYPDDVKFELIGGTVYMASPQRRPHSIYQPKLTTILTLYEQETPGVEVLVNATTILGEKSEPQPDLALRVLPEFGGRSTQNEGDYIVGAPELLVEIAHSTVSLDMNQKKEDYQQGGVLEYLVLCVEEQELHWFHFTSKRKIAPDRRGIYRSRVFPGLWIDSQALLARNLSRLMKVLQQGLASREHAAFVKKLQSARRK